MTSVEDAVLQNISAMRTDPKTKRALQDLDLLAQSVDAIGQFLEHLALAIPEDCEVDVGAALERIALAQVKSRLSGD